MACFLVSAAEAVVVTAVTAAQSKKEKKEIEAGNIDLSEGKSAALAAEGQGHVPFVKKLKWLSYMLWGGAILLAFEHLWHGEVVPWFPFLTAMADPADAMEMFHEMATVGVTMAVLITVVWLIMVAVSNVLEKRELPESSHEA
jgi:hypothetical protein